MCLAVPGRIIELNGEKAVIDFDGIRRSVVVSLLQEPRVGEYVIVHAGFAISRLDVEEAERTYQLLAEMEQAGEEVPTAAPGTTGQSD